MSELSMLSKKALIVELVERKGKIQSLQAELLKSQFLGAIRLDVVRLLGFIANRDPGSVDLDAIVPNVPEVRAIMARELEDLATHLRERATAFDQHASSIRSKPEPDNRDSDPPIN